MDITIKVKRYNPDRDHKSFFQTFNLSVEKTDRILDALMYIKDHLDGSLAFRKSCGHGVCGSDAMVINGKERLACKTLIKDVVDSENMVITVEPLSHLKVQRDLMVDQSDFFQSYKAVKPYLINDTPVDKTERIQSYDERKKYEEATKCILCASCYSACPEVDITNDFVGPAALSQGYRFTFDSRDQGLEQRMDALDAPEGVWGCENHFECTKVCPREIKITKNINTMKRKIKSLKKDS